MKYLISPHKKQFKANLHSHSNLSDGKLSPEEMKAVYRRNGYDILAITDHEAPKNHSHMSEPDFLMLTGYEGYVRKSADCSPTRYDAEIHVNFLAKDPENVSFVCYNPQCCKYLTKEQQAALHKVGSQKPREYSVEYINEYIRTGVENGYLVTYNHPVWSMESEADILAYEGYFSFEMCNYGTYVMGHEEHNGTLYNRMLSDGKRVFCHGSDDNHNKHPEGSHDWDSCGAWTMIMADELSYGKVIDALEKGEMYSSMGPVFKEVSFDGETVHVECSEVEGIFVFAGSKAVKHVWAEKGETITGADIKIDPKSRYIRVSIKDKNGKYADTRGFFRDELGLPPLD